MCPEHWDSECVSRGCWPTQPAVPALEEASGKGSSEFPASEVMSVLSAGPKAPRMLVSSPLCICLPASLLQRKPSPAVTGRENCVSGRQAS